MLACVLLSCSECACCVPVRVPAASDSPARACVVMRRDVCFRILCACARALCCAVSVCLCASCTPHSPQSPPSSLVSVRVRALSLAPCVTRDSAVPPSRALQSAQAQKCPAHTHTRTHTNTHAGSSSTVCTALSSHRSKRLHTQAHTPLVDVKRSASRALTPPFRVPCAVGMASSSFRLEHRKRRL